MSGLEKIGPGRAAPGIDRRELLARGLWAVGFAPLCCVTEPAPASAFSIEPGQVVMDRGLLPRAGSAVALVDGDRKINLIVVRAERNRYAALDRSCTHGGAQCAYNNRRKTVQCTSLNHAEFDLNGTLLHGRTHGNLRTYEVRAEGKKLVISLGAAG